MFLSHFCRYHARLSVSRLPVDEDDVCALVAGGKSFVSCEMSTRFARLDLIGSGVGIRDGTSSI